MRVKRVSVTLPDTTKKQLQKLASENYTSMSKMIKELIDFWNSNKCD